jgi:hypothetical protein
LNYYGKLKEDLDREYKRNARNLEKEQLRTRILRKDPYDDKKLTQAIVFRNEVTIFCFYLFQNKLLK